MLLYYITQFLTLSLALKLRLAQKRVLLKIWKKFLKVLATQLKTDVFI